MTSDALIDDIIDSAFLQQDPDVAYSDELAQYADDLAELS